MILKINDRFRNRVVSFFVEATVNRRFDSIGSTFSVKYFFDPNNHEHKEFSCIGHYRTCTLEQDGELLFTGIILSIEFVSSKVAELTTVSGYSLPGFLEDCEIPTEVYPLQSDLLSLRE